ncbi:hypothetical protein DOS67_01695 [Staphylococcus felis]|nr:hypothetical protein DOS67_01695 [Staphylococcus felis]
MFFNFAELWRSVENPAFGTPFIDSHKTSTRTSPQNFVKLWSAVVKSAIETPSITRLLSKAKVGTKALRI